MELRTFLGAGCTKGGGRLVTFQLPQKGIKSNYDSRDIELAIYKNCLQFDQKLWAGRYLEYLWICVIILVSWCQYCAMLLKLKYDR